MGQGLKILKSSETGFTQTVRKQKNYFLKRFNFLLLFVVTKSVSTKQLKVDRKDWNTGASKVQKKIELISPDNPVYLTGQ